MTKRTPPSQENDPHTNLGQRIVTFMDKCFYKVADVQESLLIKPFEKFTGIKVDDVLFGWLPTQEDISLFPPKSAKYVPDSDFDPIGCREKIIGKLRFHYKIYAFLTIALLLIGPRLWGSGAALALWMGKVTPIVNQAAIISRKIKLFERGNEHERRIASRLEEEFSNLGGSINSILNKNRLVSPDTGEIDIVLGFDDLRKGFLISVKSLLEAKYVYFHEGKGRLQYRRRGSHYWKEDPLTVLRGQLAEFQKYSPRLTDIVPIVVISSPTPVKVLEHLQEEMGDLKVLKVEDVYIVEESQLIRLIHQKVHR
jgi:hypothetical protein